MALATYILPKLLFLVHNDDLIIDSQEDLYLVQHLLVFSSLFNDELREILRVELRNFVKTTKSQWE